MTKLKVLNYEGDGKKREGEGANFSIFAFSQSEVVGKQAWNHKNGVYLISSP